MVQKPTTMLKKLVENIVVVDLWSRPKIIQRLQVTKYVKNVLCLSEKLYLSNNLLFIFFYSMKCLYLENKPVLISLCKRVALEKNIWAIKIRGQNWFLSWVRKFLSLDVKKVKAKKSLFPNEVQKNLLSKSKHFLRLPSLLFLLGCTTLLDGAYRSWWRQPGQWSLGITWILRVGSVTTTQHSTGLLKAPDLLLLR